MRGLNELGDLSILTDATSKVFGALTGEVAVQDGGGGGAPEGGGVGVWANSREKVTNNSAR
jgi:hypothetical protein